MDYSGNLGVFKLYGHTLLREGIYPFFNNIKYVSTHTLNITIHVQESPYQYGIPYWYCDFFDTIPVSVMIGPNTGIVRIQYVMGASVHALIQRNSLYRYMARRSIYKTIWLKHSHSPIRWYKNSPRDLLRGLITWNSYQHGPIYVYV